MNNRSKLKILLLQTRGDKIASEHEYKYMLSATNLSKNQLVNFDIAEKRIYKNYLKGFNGVIIGGSGYHIYEKSNVNDNLLEFVKYVIDQNVPVLGICYGFQTLLTVLGGRVVRSEKCEEVGSYKIYLRKSAKKDNVFRGLTDSFYAQMGHKDYINKFPKGIVSLAHTNKCGCVAFKMKDETKKIYGFLFHPELTLKGVIERLDFYKEFYIKNEKIYNRILRGGRETPSAVHHLPARFIDKVILK